MPNSPSFVAGADVFKGRWIVVVLENGAFDQAVLIDRLGDLPPHLPDLSLLANEGIDLPEHLDELTGKAPPDDLLDAAAAAWSAWRCVRGRGEALSGSESVTPLSERGVVWC